jgi:hypothetical protein
MRCARDITGTARAGADEIDRLMHGSNHLGMLAHAEVVVGAPDRNWLGRLAVHDVCLRERTPTTLHVGENPIPALALDGFEGISELLLIGHQKIFATTFIF